MNTAISIDRLSVVIDRIQILNDINAEIPTGSIVGLLGPSGAGKTTLIRAILGLQKPSSGNINILGMKPGDKPLKTKIGYVTQSPSVYADLTVLENIRYFGALLDTDEADVQSVLASVELSKYKNRVVGSLSGGQRARVSLATALLGNPEILLLDEPTVGVDPVLRQGLWNLFEKLTTDGATILVSSHVMDEADRCDSLLFMRDGRLLISDTKDKVLSRTRSTSMEKAFLKLAQEGKE